MPTIDERVVAMSFENSQFEQRINQTLSSLAKLDTAVKNIHGAQGLDDKSFSFAPIKAGFEEYQTNLGSIQTILSNTADSGGNLTTVNAALDELNTYSDKTIYNFSEMAKNIGTFTAAGVQLKPATSAIKGIANLAALSGSNSQQASTAMYQLSQAIASGKVGLQDWNSVVNAGMGGAVFQKSLMRTAENMGALKDGAVEIDKATGKATVNGQSFRESIMAKPGQQSWLTSDVLTNTLSQLTGDMTDAELAAKGFTAEQIKAIQTQAKNAQDAATQVKTLPQVFDVAKETIGSGWSATFRTIFGDFEESKKTFTEMSNFINGFINRTSDARNKMLDEWKKLGGRDELIGGIKQAFEDVTVLLKPIQQAFREIFPPQTGKDLFNLTKGFHDLMENLRPSPAVVSTIHSSFKILFNVLDIGWNIIKGVVGVFGDLLGVVGQGQGGFARFLLVISGFVDSVHDALIEGGLLATFFDGLGSILKQPVSLLLKLGHLLGSLFVSGGEKAGGAALDGVDQLNKKLPPLEQIVNNVKNAWQKLVGWFGRAKDALEPWLSSFLGTMSNLGNTIKDALSGISFDDILKGAQTGIMAGFLVMFRDLFGKGGGLMEEISKTLGGVQELLGGLTGSLDTMQKKVQAQLILAIAAAVIALAGGVYILSTIDGDKLAKAMTAVAIGLGELMGAMKLMTTGLGKFGALQLPLIAAGIIGLAIAVTIMAGALKIFGSMSWEEIGKGLLGIAGALTAIAAGMKFMPGGPAMIAQAGALLILGVALNVIAGAIKVLGTMKLAEMGKGLFGIMEALGVVALTMSMMPPNMLVNAAALGVLSFALLSMSGAIKAMGSLDFMTIVKGVGAVTVAIAGIGLAMMFIPPTIVASAAGLFIVANALVVLGKALEIIGGIGVVNLVKGLVAIGAAMVELAVGMYLMIGTLPGAVAMMAAAAALAVLAPVLGLLGNMKWSTIFKGLAAIALVLGTIAVVGLVAAPALAALGIALIPLGLGFMLVAGAAKIFASAMALMSESGQKGIAAFLVAITGFIAILPTIVISFIKGLVGIVEEIAKIAPKVVVALGAILQTIIQFVTANAAKLAVAIGLLIDAMLTVLVQNNGKIIAAGITLLTNLLNGISQNIGQVTAKVAEIIVKFLDALRAKVPQLITAGSNLLKAFLNGVASRFGEIATAVGNLIVKFTGAVGNQAGKIVTAAATMMGKFIGALATYGPQLLTAGANVVVKMLEGLGQKGPELIRRGVAVAGKLLKGIADGLVGMTKLAFDSIISFLHGLEAVIRDKDTDLINAGLGVADAILDGVVEGFGRGGHAVRTALEQVFKLLPGWAKKVLGIKSPSRVFAEIGHYTMQGYSQGIEEQKPAVRRSVEDVGRYSMQGLAKGVDDTKDLPAKAALGAGNLMVSGMRHLLGIHSPSEVFRDIGMNVNRGFKDGLLGSRDDVLNAFDTMNSSLIDKIRDLRTQVADGNTKIEDLQKQHADKLVEISKLRSEKKPDKDAIAQAVQESKDLEQQIGQETVAVDQNGRALTRAREIRKSLTGSMHDEKMQLLGLKKDYEDVSKQLEEATRTLEEAQRARDDAQKKYTDQYNAKPDVDSLVSDALADAELTAQERLDKQRKAADDAEKKRKIDQVALYKQALQEQIVATAKYQATLEKLRALGLDDATYSKLLEQGLKGQDFADQLLASGKTGVDQINALDAKALEQATALAKQAADNLYNKGIEAAKRVIDGTADGLEKGLAQRKADIEKSMNTLADIMVNAIKSKLKIKSPSRVFMEVGKFTTQGLVEGLKDATPVSNAAAQLGRSMTEALSAAVSDTGGVNPVITPVLDLTQFRKDASTMGVDNVIPITAATSYGQAAATSQEVSASQQAALEAAAAAAKPSVEFTQNNYSPESLNDVEIYRKTNNQIGRLKSALGVPA
jgi:tape measure domain-containing protein